MSSQERIKQCWEKASLFGLLSDGYRYTSLEKSAYYGKLHREWMDRLAEQVELQGTALDERDYYPGPSAPRYLPSGSANAEGGYTMQGYPGIGQQAPRPSGLQGQPAPYGLQSSSVEHRASSTPPIRMEPMSSRLRIAHASPAGPPVDIYLNQKLAAADVTYKNIVPYMTVQPGHFLIEIYPSGKTGQPLLTRTLNVQSGQSYTLVAGNKPTELQLYAYLDDPAPTAGQARLRVFHLSPDAEAVDIQTGTGTTLFGNVAFGQSTAYATTAPGKVDLQALVSGTEQIVLALPERELSTDSVTTVVVFGLSESEPTLEALLLSDL